MAKPVVRKPKKKANPLKAAKVENIDYKDTALLRKFISDRGKIRARRVTGVSSRSSVSSPRPSRTPVRWPCCPTRALLAEPFSREEPTMKLILTHEVTASVPPVTSSRSRTATAVTSSCRAVSRPRGPRAARSRSTR